MPPPGQHTTNALVVVIPVARITAQMKKSFRSRTIAAATLTTYDEHFRSIMDSYPEPFPIHSQAYLDPRLLVAACSLQTLRLFLYRHNLSSACRPSDRRDALERCFSVATDTAQYVQRSMQQGSGKPNSGFYSPTHMATWGARLRTMAPAFFCKHLLRCTLVLCLRMEFAAALTIVQASAAIGDMRKNNTSCGRYLAFFLDTLVDRLRAGASPESLGLDEEMLVYVSGDMQGCADDAWAWAGSEAVTSLDHANSYTPPDPNAHPVVGTTALTQREMHEWGGWEHIQRTLQQLLHDHQQAVQGAAAAAPHPPPPPTNSFAHATASYPSHPPSQQRTPAHHNLAPRALGPPQQSVSPVNGGASSRISIQDIM